MKHKTWTTAFRILAAAVSVLAVTTTTSLAAAGGLPAEETTIPGGNLVIIGYMILWLMIGGYLVFVSLRQQKMQREVDALEERIDSVFSDREDRS